jgi:hypothetical protein
MIAYRMVIISVTLAILLFIMACGTYNRQMNDITEEGESYILPDKEMEHLIKQMDIIQEKKIYSAFLPSKPDEEPLLDESYDSYPYGLTIAGYEPYKAYNTTGVKNISKFSTGVWDVKFIGFSADSKYMLYELGSEYYVMDLYPEDKGKTIAYKTRDKQEAKAYSEAGFIETYNYDEEADQYLKSDFFWFRVDRYQTETKKGFYVSIYDVNSTEYEYLIFSSTSGWAASLGDVSDYDFYFSPDKSWVVVQPYFADYVYDYGFILINVRKEYAKLLKKQAIDRYRSKQYEGSLTRYRQAIQLYPGTAEMFYDCAVLMKRMGMADYPIFAEKAVSIKPSKYSKKAVKDGLLSSD